MIPFYLYEKLQHSQSIIVADNAKTHRKKSSGRREPFERSRSDPVITSRNGSAASAGSKCHKNSQPEPRPGMCRWNIFTPCSSSGMLVDDETANLACNFRLNAPKPVRRGSWGELETLEPSRKPLLNGEMGLGAPSRLVPQ
eukprot:scaffold1552_cov175-Amphora_coffeaeformis.AAC.3